MSTAPAAEVMDDEQVKGRLALSRPSGNQYSRRILQSIRRIVRAVDLHSRKLSLLHNITGPQLACLLAIHALGPLTSARLAREVYLSPSTIVGILDRLEEKHLISRERSRQDRRVVDVSITKEGAVLIESAPSPLQETLAKAFENLPESERAAITTSLEKLVVLLEEEACETAPFLAADALLAPDMKNGKT